MAKQRTPDVTETIQELRRQARAQWIRALLAMMVAIPIAFLTVTLAVLLGLLAVWLIVRGFRPAFEAQKLEMSLDA